MKSRYALWRRLPEPARRYLAAAPRLAIAVLTASMALMAACRAPSDEEQRERQRAAAADAAEQEVAVAAVSRLPRRELKVADRKAWQPILDWPAACEDAFQASHAGDDGGVTFHPSGAGLWLVQVVCAAGSYQPSQVFLRFDERGSSPVAEVLTFPLRQSDSGQDVQQVLATELFGEAAVSSDGRELTLLSVSRQTADCGIWSRYALAAVNPVLREAAAKLPCPNTPGEPVSLDASRPPAGWRPITPGK